MKRAAIRDLAASAMRDRAHARNHAHVVHWEPDGDGRSLRCECGARIMARGGRAWVARAVPA